VLTGSALTEKVIGLAIKVHKQLGPGLLESVYEECLCFELADAGLTCRRQVAIPVTYRGIALDAGFRADILVDRDLIIEIKSTDALLRVHEAQVLTYLRMTGRKIGLLMNFNTVRLKDGLRRFVM
jgi:GxxExxY protein